MSRITEQDWSFEKIREIDADRAARLESGQPDELIRHLAEALNQAFDCQDVRIAVDSRCNAFTERRPTVQFQVPPELYDWFFNGRAGYRAQFWIDPKVGIEFNARIVEAAVDVLNHRLPATIAARRIEVEVNGSRQEKDTGAIEIARKELVGSLAPDASKIWIGERLYSRDGDPITDIGFATLSAAERSAAKLCVPRWAEAINPKTKQAGEGLRAPLPISENSWLDLKGGFLDAKGNPTQIKPQGERAKHIYEYGWT